MSAAAALHPMRQDEYDAWLPDELAAYGDEIATAAGIPADAARAAAEQELAELLPDGLATTSMHLFRVLDSAEEPVGVLWLGPHPMRADTGFVYDVEIDAARRGEGFGRGAMLAAEGVCRELGWTGISLQVFGHNRVARALYASLGYTVGSMRMTKSLL